MTSEFLDMSGTRVTVMGLGLHGGGLASARFCAERGATVTVTDLRSAEVLKESMQKLKEFDITYVLEKHEIQDFENADIVIKNPAVKADSPFLKAAKRVETDISIFLSVAENPVIAVTGSKGKSTVASAIALGLEEDFPEVALGGNITISPLTFLDALQQKPRDTPVVMELSSWQLGDLRGRGVLKPAVAVVTVILPDHQDRYSGMDEYINDKLVIAEGQTADDTIVLDADDPYAQRFSAASSAKALWYSKTKPSDICRAAWIEEEEGYIGSDRTHIVPSTLKVPGPHARKNLLAAATALHAYGIDPEHIRNAMAGFPGVPYRMELVVDLRGVRYYNDTAATIPDATLMAVRSFPDPIHLIAGGKDKNLDLTPIGLLRNETAHLRKVYLLAGSATDRIMPILSSEFVPFEGPFNDMESAVEAASRNAGPGDIVILSPGCASFGMFRNEFHRGDVFNAAVAGLT